MDVKLIFVIASAMCAVTAAYLSELQLSEELANVAAAKTCNRNIRHRAWVGNRDYNFYLCRSRKLPTHVLYSCSSFGERHVIVN